MGTIDGKLEVLEKMDRLTKWFEKFEKTMELIEKYPVKISELPPPEPLYEPTNIDPIKLSGYNL